MRVCRSCRAVYRRDVQYCAIDGAPVEPLAEDPNLGRIVGRYRVVRFIGSGAMGRVYVAEHQELGTAFALKVLYGDHASDRDAVNRFRREARALSGIRHPNIVTVFDFGTTVEGTAYLVMELGLGPTLAQVLETTGPVDLARTRRLGAQLSSALAEAHAGGFVHRDLKPQNVLIGAHATGETAKILDFGFVAMLQADDDSSITQTGLTFGTPAYMAPEQTQTAQVGPEADVYALGCTLFEMVDGRRPFAGDVQQVVSLKVAVPAPPLKAPPAFAALVARMLERNPALRPTAIEVYTQLTSLEALAVTPKASSILSSSTLYPLPDRHVPPKVDRSAGAMRRERRRGLRRTAVTALVGALVAFAGLAALVSERAEPRTEGRTARDSAEIVAPTSTSTLGQASVSAPVRFIVLHGCPKPGRDDCPYRLGLHRAHALTDFADDTLRKGGLRPYMASVEHVYAPDFLEPDRTVSRSAAHAALARILRHDLERFITPARQTATRWLQFASACVGSTEDILVWVWAGRTMASRPKEGRYLFANVEDIQRDVSLLARMLAQHIGVSTQLSLGDTVWRDSWTPGQVETAQLAAPDLARVRAWADGDVPIAGMEALPCKGTDRRFSPEPITDALWWSNGNLTFARERKYTRRTGLRPVAGDFDGDGTMDIYWHAPGPRLDRFLFFDSTRNEDRKFVSVNGTYRPVVGDMDGDGQDDILWLERGANVVPVWWMRPERARYDLGRISAPRWTVAVAGDFDGDGRADVLWGADGAQVVVGWGEEGCLASTNPAGWRRQFLPVHSPWGHHRDLNGAWFSARGSLPSFSLCRCRRLLPSSWSLVAVELSGL